MRTCVRAYAYACVVHMHVYDYVVVLMNTQYHTIVILLITVQEKSLNFLNLWACDTASSLIVCFSDFLSSLCIHISMLSLVTQTR